MNPKLAEKAFETLFVSDNQCSTELLLIRHAEQGDDEVGCRGLSPAGHAQASQLARATATARLTAVYTAHTEQSMETGRILAGTFGLPCRVMSQLDPIHGSDTDPGPTWVDCGSAIQAMAGLFDANPRWESLGSAESSRSFRHRVVQAIEAIAARHDGEQVAIIVDGGVINAYLSMVLDVPRDIFFAPRPASISAVRIRGNHYGLAYLNCDHAAQEAGID